MGSLYDDTETKALYYEILQSILHCDKTTLLIHGDSLMTEEKAKEFQEIVSRLKSGEPLQYILGNCIFNNLSFSVNSSVLIPRPETEELVQWILNDHNRDQQLNIIDIGTGSGCIAISLKKEWNHANVSAMDISNDALGVAKKNAQNNNVSISFYHDNILQTSNDYPQYDIIVSNPPYIMEKEKVNMHINVLDHEPSIALFVDDNDPLLFYKEIAKFGQKHLVNNGFLYFEINEMLANEMKMMLQDNGYQNIIIRKDNNNKDRMIKCQKK